MAWMSFCVDRHSRIGIGIVNGEFYMLFHVFRNGNGKIIIFFWRQQNARRESTIFFVFYFQPVAASGPILFIGTEPYVSTFFFFIYLIFFLALMSPA